MRVSACSLRVRPLQKGAIPRSVSLASSEMVKRSPGRSSNSSSSAITQSMAYSGMTGAARLALAWLPARREEGSM